MVKVHTIICRDIQANLQVTEWLINHTTIKRNRTNRWLCVVQWSLSATKQPIYHNPINKIPILIGGGEQQAQNSEKPT